MAKKLATSFSIVKHDILKSPNQLNMTPCL